MKTFAEIKAMAAERLNNIFNFTTEEQRVAEFMLQNAKLKARADQELKEKLAGTDGFSMTVGGQFIVDKEEILKIARRNRLMKAFKRIGAAVLNLFYGLFTIFVEIFIWMTMPLVAIYFASYFVPVLGTGTYAEIATIILYIIAAIAGIRGAIDASAMIRSFKVRF